MNLNIYHIALVGHIVGITMMAGTTFVDFIAFKQSGKVFASDKTKSPAMEDMLSGLQKIIGIGMLLILISGILMMVYMHQVWGEQTWFRVKMGILLLIIINGIIRRRMGTGWKKLLAGTPSDPGFDTKLSRMKSNITTVQVLQLLFFLVIFTLSVFKFN
ncbi:hypothetical protein [Chitinophaga sp. MM2321]|uniref:hypothetical protein n=1 Tax=Chitinophaga sp. MM2321 TaxID=3137178 RepID=UPI0032D56ACE